MPASNVKDDYFCLPQNLTVRTITAIQQEILQVVGNNKSTIFEFPADCQVDISFIQLMEAARIYAGTAGKHVALAQPVGGPVLEVLQRSGFLEGISAEDAKFWLHQGGIQ
ncbi:hypothetical protein ACFFP0_30245 [Rhizobium puerariae]|uniref:STAS domain-containing protein n=1 Tax=Rhizobium puerariae TaxID=1585791 RepID=A0ABV6AV14_9HYPH